jgi:1,2-diacylglycerol 3-alpha-glucosyltransferase
MKIAHLCLSCFYVDGYSYQENILIRKHSEQGHEVTVIASTETFNLEKSIDYVKPGTYFGTDGAMVIRIPYGLKPHKLARKIRWYPSLLRELKKIQPDLIFFHGLAGVALYSAGQYVKGKPSCKLVADCHEDFNNSAKGLFSKLVLHKLFYRTIFQLALPSISNVFAVTLESLSFSTKFYGSPTAKTSLLPLGGFLLSEDELLIYRSSFRESLNLKQSDIVIAQTGKLNTSKRLEKALQAFTTIDDPDLIFLIIGEMTHEVRSNCTHYINNDSRIKYLGWEPTERLKYSLAGVDFFVQPFGQTVTTQQAMCSSCAVLLQDLPSHRWLFNENGRLFKDASELTDIFSWISKNKKSVDTMRKRSYSFAKENLDYNKISIASITVGDI